MFQRQVEGIYLETSRKLRMFSFYHLNVMENEHLSLFPHILYEKSHKKI